MCYVFLSICCMCLLSVMYLLEEGGDGGLQNLGEVNSRSMDTSISIISIITTIIVIISIITTIIVIISIIISIVINIIMSIPLRCWKLVCVFVDVLCVSYYMLLGICFLVHVWLYIYIYTHTCVYVYIYIYTHIHIYCC